MAHLTVAVIRLKHISRFTDRHGHLRHYLRLPGHKPVALPGQPGGPEFMAAYHAALAAAQPAEPAPRLTQGSFDALAASYYGSQGFRGLRASTQRAYRRIVEEVRAKHGDKPIAMLDATAIKLLLADKAGAPTAVNHRLRLLRHMIAHAIELDWLERDPSAGVKRAAYRTEGFHSWTEAEIAQYQAHWPSGTRQRLALELLVCTGVRRSDAVKLGRQHLCHLTTADGRQLQALRVRQTKTEREITIPLHADLLAELAQLPAGQMTFLLTEQRGRGAGQAFTAAGFYNSFTRWAEEAGLPAGRTPHGLRKGLGRRLAEAGATSSEIQAILGHARASEAEPYVRAADQRRMAAAGLAKLVTLPKKGRQAKG